MAKKITFYSVKLKKKIQIPENNVRKVIKNNRRFLVGKYKVGKKEYEAWKILGLANKKKKKK